MITCTCVQVLFDIYIKYNYYVILLVLF